MLYIVSIEVINMHTELDRIKSTITISLGSKNRLRKLKGSQTYEEFINYLIRMRNEVIHKSNNYVDIQKFTRKKGIYSLENFKILFSFNNFIQSDNYTFDISIDTVRENGNKITYKTFLNKISKKIGKNPKNIEYITYFELLEKAIQDSVEPLFRHKGRVEDHYSWEKEFQILNLSQKTLESDIIEKLNSYRFGEAIL